MSTSRYVAGAKSRSAGLGHEDDRPTAFSAKTQLLDPSLVSPLRARKQPIVEEKGKGDESLKSGRDSDKEKLTSNRANKCRTSRSHQGPHHQRGSETGTGRDEEPTVRTSEVAHRDPPPKAFDKPPCRPRQKKRRASDSFDLDDSGEHIDKTAQVVWAQRVADRESQQQATKETSPSASCPLRSTLETPLARPKLLVRVDEVDDFPLARLEDVTALSRSLIPIELLKPPRRKRVNLSLQKPKMATTVTTASKNSMPPKTNKQKSFRKRLSFASKKKPEHRDEESDSSVSSSQKQSGEEKVPAVERGRSSRSSLRYDDAENASMLSTGSATTETTPIQSNRSGRRGVLERIRSVSRSRSSSRKTQHDAESEHKAMLVAVTSCKSDAYYNQKAPGSTSKLPRKAPSNLKLFHELAVGVKDAYAALGATPEKPVPEEEEKGTTMSPEEISARTVLWEFVGNLDFLLALVDEVAVDTATRGALKDDTTFKCLRDVIKKCNKILEGMLVRRERKYTLFFRLVQPHEKGDIESIRSWNSRVEKAVGAVADTRSVADDDSDTASDTVSGSSKSTDTSSASGRKSMFTRGRQLLPTAGRVRARRATPTPRLRQHREKSGASAGAVAADDGFSAVTTPVTSGNLAMLQRSLSVSDSARNVMRSKPPKQQLSAAKPVKPKDELVDVIRGLREEKMKNRLASTSDSELANLKPDWMPKADIPSAVPNLPFEYIHRHRLMKQVVNCLCDNSGAGPRDTDEETPAASFITSITSRHGDKAGNGKTTLAVASIQTVEVRERFPDGIGWVHLGRNPLDEKDIRRLYDELYRQLFDRDSVHDGNSVQGSSDDKADTASRGGSSFGSLDDKGGKSDTEHDISMQIASTRRRFQGGDLESIKEELGQLIAQRKILICLDDVWRVEDAKWFVFDQLVKKSVESPDSNLCRILVTTRTPSLLGAGVVQEVFVRIFSEHEAVKLLLSSAGRRPYGGKNSAVFNQARGIVKGCGNAPLAVRIAGGMLRHNNRNWNLSSAIWKVLLGQCRMSLEEASRLRSFAHSVSRIVDLSFLSVEDLAVRCCMRRCLVTFAAAFGEHEWVLVGRGIPQCVILKLFSSTIAAGLDEACQPPAELVLEGLEAVHLLQRARHGCHSPKSDYASDQIESGGEGEAHDDESLGDALTSHLSSIDSFDNTSFLISDAVKAVAERISERASPAFLPTLDDYTSFADETDAEAVFVQKRGGQGPLWAAPFRHIADQLSHNNGKGERLSDSEVHDLVVGSLLDARVASRPILQAFHDTEGIVAGTKGGDKLEEYLVTFMPTHLIRAESHPVAAEFLVDEEFVRRRVRALGVVESTRRHVSDLLDLRRECSHGPPSSKKSLSKPNGVGSNEGEATSTGLRRVASDDQGGENVDGNAALRDGCLLIIEEVFRHDHDALDRALCLSLVGDGLLKGKQQRDAMLRLEEALGIYRGILGSTNRSIDVARSLNAVARALTKLGEARMALLKFAEATRIYDVCNANLQHDAIANAQNYASLLVDVGDWSSADAKFEEVFSAKKTVYGANSVPVAKAINSYAILLAKYGRMEKALVHYQRAMSIYRTLAPPLIRDPEFEMKCNYDVTLINLNIASICSKKGDLKGAIASYEEGVKGLREHADEQGLLRKAGHAGEAVKSTSQHKHLVAALGRVGSLKLKMGDFEGALEAYTTLLQEVKEDSPATSRVEKAKAHIKCATIHRQDDTKESRIKSISHLREALEMYTVLFGADHKDTTAIASSLRQWLSEDRQARMESERINL